MSYGSQRNARVVPLVVLLVVSLVVLLYIDLMPSTTQALSPLVSGVASLESARQARSSYAVVCDNGDEAEGTLEPDYDTARKVFKERAGTSKPCMLFGKVYTSAGGALGNELLHHRGAGWRAQDHWANKFAQRMRKWYIRHAVSPVDFSSAPSVLDTNFSIKREQVFDNYMMNGDVIALSAGEDLFVDTSMSPMGVRARKDISEHGDLYVVVTFWAPDGVGEVVNFDGQIGLQTYPKRQRILPSVHGLRLADSGDPEWWHLTFQHVGNEGIRILLYGQLYLRVDESTKQLVTAGSAVDATVFKVQRFRERLATKLRGVNLASWFNVESWSAHDFFTGSGYNTTGMHFPTQETDMPEVLAKSLGEEDFRRHYKEHLSTFLDPEEDFKYMALLGLNAVRIPCPLEMFLPLDGNYTVEDSDYDVNFMSRCYQDACSFMDKVFDAADKYGVGIILSNFAIYNHGRVMAGKKDTAVWLQFVETATARYHTRRSFLGLDLINEPDMDGNILHAYWMAGYDVVRRYSPKALVLMSDRYWASQLETKQWFPRLTPDMTGIVVDSHVYQKKMADKIEGRDYAAIVTKVDTEFSAQFKAFTRQYITIAGEFSCQFETDMHWSSKDEEIVKEKDYMKVLTRIATEIGDGGLDYQWHVQYDDWVPFHSWSYMNLANYGFNLIFMSSDMRPLESKAVNTSELRFVSSDAGSGAYMNLSCYEYTDADWLMLGHSHGGPMVVVKPGPMIRPAASWVHIWSDEGSGGDYGYDVWAPQCNDSDFVPVGVVCAFGSNRKLRSEPGAWPIALVHRSLVELTGLGDVVWSDRGTGAKWDVTLNNVTEMGTMWPSVATYLGDTPPQAHKIKAAYLEALPDANRYSLSEVQQDQTVWI